jgi:PTS system ascorbate-specific IIB component
MITIVTACGAGQGSSLILRMWTEDVVKEMGIEARVEAMDASAAKSARCDLVLTSKSLVHVVEGPRHDTRWVTNYLDKDSIREQLEGFCDSRGISYKK